MNCHMSKWNSLVREESFRSVRKFKKKRVLYLHLGASRPAHACRSYGRSRASCDPIESISIKVRTILDAFLRCDRP